MITVGGRRLWTAAEDAYIRHAARSLDIRQRDAKHEHAAGARGPRWRQIAATLDGRSEEAVRNRWLRLCAIDEAAASTNGTELSRYKCSRCGQPKKGHKCSAAGSDTGDARPRHGNKRRHAELVAAHPGHAAPMTYIEGVQHETGGEGDGVRGARTREAAEHTWCAPAAHAAAPPLGGWTAAEDAEICQGVAELGSRWALIAGRLHGRSPNAARNRYHRLIHDPHAAATAAMGTARQPLQVVAQPARDPPVLAATDEGDQGGEPLEAAGLAVAIAYEVGSFAPVGMALMGHG